MYSEKVERRLRPIFDAIECHQYKNGIKLAEQAEKKLGYNQMVQVLKAYSLIGIGSVSDGLKILNDIVEHGPESSRVLSIMTYCYKDADRLCDIVEAYAAALRGSPTEEELLVGTFAAYGRVGNYAKQQAYALQLQKSYPQNTSYPWWIAVASSLQARALVLALEEEEALPPLVLLTARLMERAWQRTPEPGRTYEMLLVYLDALHAAGEHEAALKVLETGGEELCASVADYRYLVAAALARGGQFEAAAEQLERLGSHRDCASIRLSLNCALRDVCEEGDVSVHLRTAFVPIWPVGVVGGLAEVVEGRDAYARVNPESLITTDYSVLWPLSRAQHSLLMDRHLRLEAECEPVAGEKAAHVRPSLLALLESQTTQFFVSKASLGGSDDEGNVASTEEQEPLASRIADVFERISSLDCAATDLRPFLAQITDASYVEMLAQRVRDHAENTLSSIVDDEDDSLLVADRPGQLAAFKTVVNAEQVLYELGEEGVRPTETTLQRAFELLTSHESFQHLSADLDPKETGPGDRLISLAVAHLVAQAAEKDRVHSVMIILLALLIVEAEQLKRTASASLRLSAAGLYSLLGCPEAARRQLEALGVKQIMHDTLTSHWILPILLGKDALQKAPLHRCLEGILTLHRGHAREGGDSTMSAYQHGSYSKVAELISFKERMAASHSLQVAEAEDAIRELRNATWECKGDSGGMYRAVQSIVNRSNSIYPGENKPESHMIAFNEDLSTRPAWLPPPGRVPLTLEGVLEQVSSSIKEERCPPCRAWWRQSGVEPSKCKYERSEWRDEQRELLQERQGIPKLLLAALKNEGGPASESEPEDDPLILAGPDEPEFFWEHVYAIADAIWMSRGNVNDLFPRLKAWCLNELDKLEELALVPDVMSTWTTVSRTIAATQGPHLVFLVEQGPFLAHCLLAWLKHLESENATGDKDSQACSTALRELGKELHERMQGIVSRMNTSKQSWSGSELALEMLEFVEMVDKNENTEFQQFSSPALGLEFARDVINVIIDEQCSAMMDVQQHAKQFVDLYGCIL